MNETLNKQDWARAVSVKTGYTIKEVLEVMNAEDEVLQLAIQKKLSIKRGKYWKIHFVKEKERKAYDGIKKEYYVLPQRQVMKFKPLSKLVKCKKS